MATGKWAKTKVKKKSKSNKKKTKRRKSTSRTNTNLSINRQFTMLLKDVRRLAEISEMAEKMKT
jgi:hypothetical protein